MTNLGALPKVKTQISLSNYLKFLNFWTPKNCNLPKIQEKRPNLGVFQKDANGIANTEYPDQTAPLRSRSDLGLHCLPRPICPKTLDHYGTQFDHSLHCPHEDC